MNHASRQSFAAAREEHRSRSGTPARLLGTAGSAPRNSRAETNSDSGLASVASHSIADISIHPSPPIQAKLKVGEQDDCFEREADRVMNLPMMNQLSAPIGMPSTSSTNGVRGEAPVGRLQAYSKSGMRSDVSPDVGRNIEGLRGGGRPMPESSRAFFEPRFGRDFSDVRLHTDAGAASTAEAINARAFTVGRDVVFGGGEYAPETNEGRRLLAHELTHVVQQNGGASAPEAGTVQRATSDYQITEIDPNDAANPDMIFFESGNTSIPASETHKIAGLATPAGRNLTLNGFASEEGTDAANDTLIQARMASVDAALAAAGHTGARAQVNLRSSGEGQINYRHMRSVEVIPTPVGMTSAPSGVSSCAGAGAQTAPCGTALTGSWPDANKAMIKAVAELAGPSAAASTLLGRLFSLVPVATVRTNISNLATQVAGLDPAASAASQYRHQCHNHCDAGCGRPAYNDQAGLGPSGAMMTLCPDFLNSSNTDWQAQILIHESAHGTPGLNADDIAYSHTRQISFLSASDQVRNTDSYMALAWLLYKPGSLTVGPSTPDTLTGMTAAEETQAREAVAWLESWLNYGDFDTEILYETMHRSVPPAPGWATQSGDAFNRETMHLLAPIFGLTDPGTSAPFTQPTERDKTKVAAVHDQYDQMYAAVNWQTLTITKGAAGSGAWGSHGASLPRLSQTVTVEPNFFTLSAADRVKNLILLMATGMHGISSGFRSKYVDGMDAIRTHRTLGP